MIVTPTDFPMAVDNSMISAYKSCPALFYYQYLRSLSPTAKSIHLHAGGAYAKGLEVARFAYWRDGASEQAALAAGVRALVQEWGDYKESEDETKSLSNMMLALEAYFEHYGWKEDHIQPYFPRAGEPAVEFSFAIPFEDILHPQTGDPILYAGRFDMIGLHEGALYAVDEKTTKQLGASWGNQWELRSQFMGYCWAAQHYGHPVAGAIVRGISILKHEFGHKQVIVHNPPHKLEKWLETTKHYLRCMVDDWKQGRFMQVFDSACSHYGGCPFHIVCGKLNPERTLQANFVTRVWDPLHKE